MADLLDLSLNEVEMLAQKAGRGAGLPWGVAEDTGRAAAWLCRRCGAWAEQFLALLETSPKPSPLLLAGLLADGATPRQPAHLAAPLWALPGLLATTARPVTIQLDTAEIRCNPGADATATLPAEALAAISAATLTITFSAAPLPPLPHVLSAKFRRSLLPRAEWQRLEAFAYRTYVPASDHSRLTGAGAGAGLLDDE